MSGFLGPLFPERLGPREPPTVTPSPLRKLTVNSGGHGVTLGGDQQRVPQCQCGQHPLGLLELYVGNLETLQWGDNVSGHTPTMSPRKQVTVLGRKYKMSLPGVGDPRKDSGTRRGSLRLWTAAGQDTQTGPPPTIRTGQSHRDTKTHSGGPQYVESYRDTPGVEKHRLCFLWALGQVRLLL